MKPAQRLAELMTEAATARRELAILEEQLLHQREVQGEANLRAVVSETPLADREADQATRDLARLERVRDEVAASLARLSGEIDRLLDETAAR